MKVRNLTFGEAYCDRPCPVNEFYYSNSSCLPSCSNPFFIVNQTYYLECRFPCNSTDFLLQNGTCTKICPYPFFTINSSTYKNCSFPCQSDQYLLPDDSCSSTCPNPMFAAIKSTIESYCHPPCHPEEFFFSSNNTCLSECLTPYIKKNYTYFTLCTISCAAPNFYYENTTCLDSCPFPFLTKNESDYMICLFPCGVSGYLMPNNTCVESCPYPYLPYLNSNYEHYCLPPCLNGQFFYQNGSCLDICLSPLISWNMAFYKTCDHPCANASDFWYENGTCSEKCEDPFYPAKLLSGYSCQFPCPVGQIFYRNNSCLPTCDSKLFMVKDYSPGVVCEFPCSINKFYETSTSECIDSCNDPSIKVVTNLGSYCYPNPEQSENIRVISQVGKVLITSSVSAAGSLITLGFDPTTFTTFINVLQSFFYLLFFNVAYPKNVESILGNFNLVNLNFLPNPLYWFYDDIPDVPSPSRFYDNGYSGLFFETAGRNVLIVLGYLTLTLLTFIFGKLIRSRSVLSKLCSLAYSKLEVNQAIRIFVIMYMDILICSFLNILSKEVEGNLFTFSRTVAYVFFTFCLLFPFLMLMYLKRKNNTFDSLKKIEALIEDYDINNSDRKNFGFFILLKKEIHSLAVLGFYHIPLFQILVPILTNIVIMIGYVKYKPHHRMEMNIFETIFEFGAFVLQLCVLCLAYFDTKGINDPDIRDFIGFVMLGIIGMDLIVCMTQVWMENFTILKGFWKKLKKTFDKKERKQKSKTTKTKRVKVKRRTKKNSFIV